MKPISFAAALRDVRLLGRSFNKPSHRPWHVIAKMMSGERLEAAELSLALELTGRTRLPSEAVRRLYLLIGRRGGKSRFLSACAVWVAALAANWRELLAPGEDAVVLLLGRDKTQARILRRYAEGLLQAELLKPVVTRQTTDRIELQSGAVLEVATNDARTIRGRTVIALLGDEASHWKSDGESESSDEEVVAAASPGMATVPGGGWLLLGSTTYRKKGLMYRKFAELHGNDTAADLCVLAASQTMHPTLSAEFIEGELAKDPAKNRAEYLSEWRSDVSDFLPLEVVESCTDWGVRERPPVPGIKYFGFVDAATGTGTDSMALGIAHVVGTEVVLDAIRERKPQFSPEAVAGEHTALLRLYGVTEVRGDHQTAWVRTYYERGGVLWIPSRWNKSEIYLATLPLMMSGRARLFDDEVLRRQLTGLERRTHAEGRESVDHGRSASAHDDVANVACGALLTAFTMANLKVPMAWPVIIVNGEELVTSAAPVEVETGRARANAVKPPQHYLRQAAPWSGYVGGGANLRSPCAWGPVDTSGRPP
jgi:hypothetical protein